MPAMASRWRLTTRSVANEGGSPGQAGAKRDQAHQLARLDLAELDRLVHADRNRRCSGVAIALDVVVHLLRRKTDHLSDHLIDSQIGLVRNHHIDIAELEIVIGPERKWKGTVQLEADEPTALPGLVVALEPRRGTAFPSRAQVSKEREFAVNSPMPSPESAEGGVYCDDGCHEIKPKYGMPKVKKGTGSFRQTEAAVHLK